MKIFPYLAGLIILAGLPAAPCTVFKMASDDKVVFASNEDGRNSNARIWFRTGSEGMHGGVYFGFDDGFKQGGMNTAGLCFDITACPRMTRIEKEGSQVPEGNIIDEAMERCSTVGEVVALFNRYDLRGFERVQVMFTDRNGSSVVIDCNHVTEGDAAYQVITNYYISEPGLGRYPCGRMDIARHLLNEPVVTVDHARRILSAVRQEGRSQTQYSYICEPREGRVTVYRFHDFEQPAAFTLEEELAAGDREVILSEIFQYGNFALEDHEKRESRKLSRVFMKTLSEKGMKAALEEFARTKINYSEILNELANIGFILQGDGKMAEAAAVFGLMTEEFPTFARGFEWLGNALAAAGDSNGAITAYRRSLRIEPGNNRVKRSLEKLTGKN